MRVHARGRCRRVLYANRRTLLDLNLTPRWGLEEAVCRHLLLLREQLLLKL